jgi:hypothetical protein
VSGDFTVYCGACSRPVLLRRRKAQYPVAGVVVLNVDGEGIASAVCPCGETWERDSETTVNLVR